MPSLGKWLERVISTVIALLSERRDQDTSAPIAPLVRIEPRKLAPLGGDGGRAPAD